MSKSEILAALQELQISIDNLFLTTNMMFHKFSTSRQSCSAELHLPPSTLPPPLATGSEFQWPLKPSPTTLAPITYPPPPLLPLPGNSVLSSVLVTSPPSHTAHIQLPLLPSSPPTDVIPTQSPTNFVPFHYVLPPPPQPLAPVDHRPATLPTPSATPLLIPKSIKIPPPKPPPPPMLHPPPPAPPPTPPPPIPPPPIEPPPPDAPPQPATPQPLPPLVPEPPPPPILSSQYYHRLPSPSTFSASTVTPSSHPFSVTTSPPPQKISTATALRRAPLLPQSSSLRIDPRPATLPQPMTAPPLLPRTVGNTFRQHFQPVEPFPIPSVPVTNPPPSETHTKPQLQPPTPPPTDIAINPPLFHPLPPPTPPPPIPRPPKEPPPDLPHPPATTPQISHPPNYSPISHLESHPPTILPPPFPPPPNPPHITPPPAPRPPHQLQDDQILQFLHCRPPPAIPTPLLPITSLSPTVFKEERDRGLCYNGDPKWSLTHRCRTTLLLLKCLEDDDKIEPPDPGDNYLVYDNSRIVLCRELPPNTHLVSFLQLPTMVFDDSIDEKFEIDFWPTLPDDKPNSYFMNWPNISGPNSVISATQIPSARNLLLCPVCQFQKVELANPVTAMASRSPFSSSGLLVREMDQTYRFYVDSRALDGGLLNELFDNLGTARKITKLDLRSSYHQIRVQGRDIHTMFRISKLFPFVGSDTIPICALPDVALDFSPAPQPLAICGELNILISEGTQQQVLVHWGGELSECSTWEVKQGMSRLFTNSNLEDKVIFQGVWNDTLTKMGRLQKKPSSGKPNDRRPLHVRNLPAQGIR